MNTLWIAVAGVLLAGCGGSNTNSSNSASGSSEDYLGTLASSQQKAVKTVDTTALNQAVSLFNVERGRYPKDLEELVKEKYIAVIPPAPHGMKLEYDSATGKVSVVKQ